MDMRKEIRYRLEAPTVFTWENFEHKRLQGEGITRDISLLGAFILSATCPPNLTSIRVEVALPSVVGIEADIRIIGQAQVVRVEHSHAGHGENGFAVVPFDLHNWSLLTYKNGSLYHRELNAPASMNFG
jgi:hypothetical protein